ncbi:Mu-like prophage FluMu protein GP28 [Magnetospirillum fulvum]|uniref:Mu-like prophage FluMu protein GP28 n=1 Tax=Magnetospirillum fulvum MGU-K5 TaxID=1316936 RepID=S9S4I4_MAGFU|nr:Mu-like prophage FluMu protein GP28 [Magnetospirillum fulvum]EPY00872.1 Mu-like prophage FluMu protein GP28 [Magnetospirillum fulvum MGU-K5]
MTGGALSKALPSADTPEILLGYQKRLLATVAANAVTVCEKSRRIGVTWGIGAQAVLMAGAERAAGGMDVLYIGYNLDMAREFIAVCGQWAKAFGKAASEVGEFLFRDGDDDIQAFRVNFGSGFEIVALASRPRSLRGRQGFVIIDEAAFHDDLGELLKSALALLIWGGKVLVISTHDGAANPFNELVEECRKGRKPYALLRITFNDALDDGLYERVCLKKGETPTPQGKVAWEAEIRAFYGDDADEELDVNPKQGTGVYLPTWLIESRMADGIPVVRWSQPDAFAQFAEHLRIAETKDFCEGMLKPLLERMNPDLQSFFGWDFARKGDLSVKWPVQLMPNLVRRPPFILELRNIPFEQQKQVGFYVVRRLPRFMAGALDATGNGAYLAEVMAQEFGFDRIAQIHLSEAWYRDAMPKFKAAFEDGTTVLPKDADTLSDHKSIRLVRGVPVIPREGKAGGKGEDKKQSAMRHGDSAVAHVLADFATRMDTPDMDACEASGDHREAAELGHASGDGWSGWGDGGNDSWEGFQ